MVEVRVDNRSSIATADEDKKDSVVQVKHLLQNSWTLWFFRNDREAKDWSSNQTEVATVGTVEDFWALYNHIECCSKLPQGCDYSIFKKGIQPAWEDAKNKNGGRWMIQLDKSPSKADTDKYWMEICMMLVGEAFEDDNELVNGAVVSVRGKGDRLAVWLSCDHSKEDRIKQIGRLIKKRLEINKSINFQTHADSAAKNSSNVKSTFSV
ncbi:unnamed protein product [Notodromas monacha]|uniref:eIF-4F 25 kDa subunit n=1 Tax=Notodromas monacha TaxID=399045 RepID=A0A7R9GH13_9CRUS|nr:unnamed protein product [Notodromas monacha]CAG0922279.1 unnamed protein product [Notodromas monacha]